MSIKVSFYAELSIKSGKGKKKRSKIRYRLHSSETLCAQGHVLPGGI